MEKPKYITQEQTKKSWELDIWVRWPGAVISQKGTRAEAHLDNILVGYMQLYPIQLTKPLFGRGFIRYTPIR